MLYLRRVETSKPSKRLSLSKHDLNNIKENSSNLESQDISINQNDFLAVLEKEYEKVKRK